MNDFNGINDYNSVSSDGRETYDTFFINYTENSRDTQSTPDKE